MRSVRKGVEQEDQGIHPMKQPAFVQALRSCYKTKTCSTAGANLEEKGKAHGEAVFREGQCSGLQPAVGELFLGKKRRFNKVKGECRGCCVQVAGGPLRVDAVLAKSFYQGCEEACPCTTTGSELSSWKSSFLHELWAVRENLS